MIPAEETFGGTFPFAPHFTTAPGFRMHYVDEGPQDARNTVVLLHGEPTWGYLFREVIAPLAERHRVVVPDHMGFGKSETPQEREYTAQAHVDNLTALLLDLNLTGITLVLHDWGGPIGTGFALQHPDRIRRIIVTNSVMPLGLPEEAELLPQNATSRWFHWAGQAQADGTLEEILGNAGVTILTLMKGLQGFERMEKVTDDWLRAYSLPFATRAECRGVIAFPRSIVTGQGSQITPGHPAAVAALRQKPALMIEGMKDYALLPEIFIPLFQAAFPQAPVHRLAHAGHFLYEDAPETLAALILQFIALT